MVYNVLFPKIKVTQAPLSSNRARLRDWSEPLRTRGLSYSCNMQRASIISVIRSVDDVNHGLAARCRACGIPLVARVYVRKETAVAVLREVAKMKPSRWVVSADDGGDMCDILSQPDALEVSAILMWSARRN